MHTDAIRGIFELGLSIQSQAARMDLPARLRSGVDELVSVLDAAVHEAQLSAFEVGTRSTASPVVSPECPLVTGVPAVPGDVPSTNGGLGKPQRDLPPVCGQGDLAWGGDVDWKVTAGL